LDKFGFSDSPKIFQLPKIYQIANLLSSKLLEIGKSKNLPIAQNSPNHPKMSQIGAGFGEHHER
jgi:hypothetical protein